MVKKLLSQKEQWYAGTIEEAKEVVAAAEENDALVMNKISEKHNKYGEYHLVDLTYQYGTPRDVMEGGDGKSESPDGQLTIEEVEPEEENYDHIQFEDPDASKVVVTPEDENGLPF